MYHGINQFAVDCKWLDLRKLCENYLKSDESISDVYYFSAVAHWFKDAGKSKRHKTYIAKLRENGVKIKLGKFKEKDKSCPVCNAKYKSHEEKRTDVNIALQIVCDAFEDKYDTAILVSGDTDMIPAVEMLKSMGLNKKIGVLFPPGRGTNELRNAVDFSKNIKPADLRKCLFDKSDAPDEWKQFLKKQSEVAALVDKIIAAEKSAATSGLERQIDKIVYELYGLTEEEIDFIENR